MSSLAISILMSLGQSLVTKKFFIKMFLIAGEKIIKCTSNDLDDQIFNAVKESLNEKK